MAGTAGLAAGAGWRTSVCWVRMWQSRMSCTSMVQLCCHTRRSRRACSHPASFCKHATWHAKTHLTGVAETAQLRHCQLLVFTQGKLSSSGARLCKTVCVFFCVCCTSVMSTPAGCVFVGWRGHRKEYYRQATSAAAVGGAISAPACMQAGLDRGGSSLRHLWGFGGGRM